jgi:hypothetical protein
LILVLVPGGSRLVWRGEFDAILGCGWRVNRGQVAALALLCGRLWLLIVGVVWANKERCRQVTVADARLERAYVPRHAAYRGHRVLVTSPDCRQVRVRTVRSSLDSPNVTPILIRRVD